MDKKKDRTSYDGRHAELYDLIYQDKLYRAEAAFVHKCLEDFGTGKTKRILELACGTGTHAFEFEKLGYDVVAVDHSPDMLDMAKKKAGGLLSKVDFRIQDMRELDLPDGPFDAAACLFDSIGYVQTNEAILKVLAGVHCHLRPEGLFIFEFWHAAAMLRHNDPLRIRRWKIPGGEILRISETTLDLSKQVSNVSYSIYEINNDGTYSTIKETQTNRYFLVQEMSGWLSGCGFTPIRFFAGFADDENITDRTWHVLAVARRMME